jgi:branched-chain amino acid transport system ATP-binding protein
MADRSGLSIRGAVAGYGEGIVIDGLDLDVAPGEAVALLGRNGAGKTTLLKTVMGLVPLRAGAIHFGEQRLDRLEPFARARCGLGYVPQGRDVFQDLTVEENLLLGDLSAPDAAPAYGLFPALRERREEAAGRLSGGQQQQLAIARALMGQPRLLLLDEPSEGIQPSVVDEIVAALTRIARERAMGLLIVEQNLDMALALASRVALVEQGRIAASHEATAARADPSLVERFLSL